MYGLEIAGDFGFASAVEIIETGSESSPFSKEFFNKLCGRCWCARPARVLDKMCCCLICARHVAGSDRVLTPKTSLGPV